MSKYALLIILSTICGDLFSQNEAIGILQTLAAEERMNTENLESVQIKTYQTFVWDDSREPDTLMIGTQGDTTKLYLESYDNRIITDKNNVTELDMMFINTMKKTNSYPSLTN